MRKSLIGVVFQELGLQVKAALEHPEEFDKGLASKNKNYQGSKG